MGRGRNSERRREADHESRSRDTAGKTQTREECHDTTPFNASIGAECNPVVTMPALGAAMDLNIDPVTSVVGQSCTMPPQCHPPGGRLIGETADGHAANINRHHKKAASGWELAAVSPPPSVVAVVMNRLLSGKTGHRPIRHRHRDFLDQPAIGREAVDHPHAGPGRPVIAVDVQCAAIRAAFFIRHIGKAAPIADRRRLPASKSQQSIQGPRVSE